MTTFRRTTGIVSDKGDPGKEADVIMTAMILGFTAWRLGDPTDDNSPLKPIETGPIKFDADPGTCENPISDADYRKLEDATGRVQRAVAAYLKTKSPTKVVMVTPGKSGAWSAGASIMGVYSAAGQTAPDNIAKLQNLSVNGAALWDAIKKGNSVSQYTGRGAYSGFVDDSNEKVLAGPLSSARFWASNAQTSPERWLPTMDVTGPSWVSRVPKKNATDPAPTPFAWGLIIGKEVGEAQKITDAMKTNGMVFNGAEAANGVDVAMYTHGMIQAIYLAYGHGPNCCAYEIAVGTDTTKMASCIPCTFFMAANGYFPNSIHLGRGESWAPLFTPYVPAGTKADPQVITGLPTVIDDLNKSWYERCLLWIQKGLDILTTDQLLDEAHTTARNALNVYIINHVKTDQRLGGRLVLDAVTMHDSEQERLLRTLKP